MPSFSRPHAARTLRSGARVIAVVGAVAACGGEPGERNGAGPAVTDSAGITLVTNGVAPLWAPEEAWWVEEILRIGGDEAIPESLFGYVADVAVGDEGRIYVLDRLAQAVRVFRDDGHYLRTLGGPGEGPGELGKLPGSVLAVRGEVWVPDWSQARVTRWSPEGAVLGTAPTPHESGARSWWQAGVDGEMRFRVVTGASGKGGEAPSRPDRLYRLTGDGTAELVLEFPAAAAAPSASDDFALEAVVNAPAWAALRDGSVAWTTLHAPEIRVRRTDGSEMRIRSATWIPHPPGEAERTLLDALVAEHVRMLGGSSAKAEALSTRYPEALPILTDLHAGPEGTIWVQRPGSLREVHPMAMNTPDPPRGWGGSTWEILSSDGAYLGSLELPPRFRVMRVGEDAVIGVQSDLQRVDRVVVLALRRPEPAR